MSRYFKAEGIRQIPDEENPDYLLATIRTSIFNYFNIRKIEIDASFERPTGKEPFRYLICSFYYYCHTNRYCLLANIELVDMYWNRYIDMYFPKLGIDAGVCDAWSNTFPSVPGWRNDADPRGKITMTFGDSASGYHFEVEHDDTKHEVKADVTASIPRMPHGSDYADEAHLSPNYAASLGGHSVDWNVPGTATKGPRLTVSYCPFSIYSFKAWDKKGELITDLRSMVITDDDKSNPRGAMYDALVNEIHEPVLYNNLGNSRFDPINPDYDQELFFGTPDPPEPPNPPEPPEEKEYKLFTGENTPYDLVLNSHLASEVYYGEEWIWNEKEEQKI